MTSSLLSSIVLYSSTRFGTQAEHWHQLADCVARLCSCPPFAHAWAYGKVGLRDVPSRQLSTAHGETLAKAVVGDRVSQVNLADVTRREAERTESMAYLSVAYNRRTAFRPSEPEPQQRLPCEVMILTAIEPQWPETAQLTALKELLQIADAEYACLFVGDDTVRASSEWLFSPMIPMETRARPTWADEMQRIAFARCEFGTKVRGVYWGNVFPPDVVDQIGGIEALRATGAAIVEPLDSGRVYVQLTTHATDAISEAGKDRLHRLETVLAPVRV